MKKFECHNPDLLEAYYRGAFEAYEEAIELFRKEFCNEKLEAKLISFFNKLQYEKECAGVLFEDIVRKRKHFRIARHEKH